MGTRIGVAAAVVLAAWLAALSLGACAPAQAPPTSISALAELGPLLVPAAPAGFALVDDPVQTGPLTSGQVAELSDDPAKQQASLITFGYLDGYQKTFERSGDTLYATLEQYTAPDGAARRAGQLRSEAEALGERTPFDVGTLPDAFGNTFGGRAEGFDTVQQHQVVFAFDTLVVRVEATSDAGTLSPRDALDVAQTQLEVLRRSSEAGG